MIFRDAIDSLTLNANGYNVLRFDMGSSDMEREAQKGAVGDWPSEAQMRDVSGSIDLLIVGSTQADVQSKLGVLQRIISRIPNGNLWNPLRRVRIQMQTDGDTELWTTDVVLAKLEVSDPLDKLYKLKVPCTIYFTRRPYWYGAEAELHLTSATYPAETTGGVVIANTNNANFVKIASTRVKGSIPAPVRLDVANSQAGTTRYQTGFWAVNNAHYAPDTLDFWLTAAESVGGSGAMSNGTAVRWLLPDLMVDTMAGGYARALAVFSGRPAYLYLGASVQVGLGGGSSYITAYSGGGRDVDQMHVVDLGLFPIPPGGVSAGYGQIYFTLSGYVQGDFSATLHHVQLIPVSSEKQLAMLGSFSGLGMPEGEAAVSDDILGENYCESTAGERYPVLLGRGGPLLVYPNVTQTIAITWAGFSGVWYAHNSIVRAWYRPRRWSL